MTIVFDTYVPGGSLLHRLDPRVKLWGVMLALTLAFLLPDLLSQAVFIVAIHAVVLVSGISWRVLVRVWRQMAILLVLIMALQPFFRPHGALLVAIGPLRLTMGGLEEALRLAMRAVGIAFAMAALLFTTEHNALIRALVRLGLPYTWGLTVSLALRFLPAIQSLFRAVRDAQAARGWVAEGNLIRRFREYIPVLVAVMIGTLRMSDQLTLSLAARGLETMQRRTTWRDLHMRWHDWSVLILTSLGFGAFILWRFGL